MPKPNPIPGCPEGLEYLSQIDKIMVEQKVDLLEGYLICFFLFIKLILNIFLAFTGKK
jgi:hypothetical protein